MTSDRQLMALHVEALFTHDAAGDLVCVNEPRGAPAPRLFIGRTANGAVWRFRHDVGPELRRQLKEAATESDGRGAEVRGDHVLDSPPNPSPYEEILARSAPVQRTWTGPAFCFPSELAATADTILVTEDTAHVLDPLLPAWLPDVRPCQPMVALTVDGHAVAVCCSGRRTDMAHEAAVETALSYRGRGYALHVVAAWARAVRDVGRVPLYSTSWRNESSRALARKLGLTQFGSDLHVT